MQSSPYAVLIRRGLDQAMQGHLDVTTFGQLSALSSSGSWTADGYAVVRPQGDDRLVLHGPGGRMAILNTSCCSVKSYHPATQALAPAEPTASTLVPPPTPRFEGPEVMDRLFPIVAVVFGAITLISLGQPFVRAWVKRLERKWAGEPRPLDDMTRRFDRIEQAVEAVAIEVERIGEAQRYQARVLAERPPAQVEGARTRTPRTPPQGVAR